MESQPAFSVYQTLPLGSALRFRLKNKQSHWFWSVHEKPNHFIAVHMCHQYRKLSVWNCQGILKLVLQHNLIPVDLSCLVILTVVFFIFQKAECTKLSKCWICQVIQKLNLLIAAIPFDLNCIVKIYWSGCCSSGVELPLEVFVVESVWEDFFLEIL